MNSVREQVLQAFKTALDGAASASVVVDRNRDIPVELTTSTSWIVMVDGGQEPDVETGPGYKQIALGVDVEMFAATASHGGLAAALDALYVAVVQSALADRTLGGLAVDITEGELTDPILDRSEGIGPTIAASLSFSIDYWVDVDDPTIAAP